MLHMFLFLFQTPWVKTMPVDSLRCEKSQPFFLHRKKPASWPEMKWISWEFLNFTQPPSSTMWVWKFFCPKIRWEFSMRVPGPQAREATTGSQNHRFSSFLPSRICIQKRWLSMEKTLKPLKPCCKKWIGGSILAHHLGWWECGKKRRQDSFYDSH